MGAISKLKDFLLNNKTDGQTVVKNTFWLVFGQVVSRGLRAAIVIYAARVLGAAGWGAFSYALGIAAFLTIFSDIGINALITKETSRNPELKQQYLATAFFIKLALLVIFITGIAILFPYLTNIPEAAALMPILIFVFAFDTLRDLGSALSRALEKMEIESLVNMFTNLAIVSLGFIFLSVSKSTYSLAYAYALGSALGLAVIFYALRHHFGNIFTNFNKELVKPILTTAWPFGLMGLMGAVMLNTDIIMIGWIRSASEVGYYSAAQKLILLAYVLPGLFSSSIFPVLSRLAKTEPERAKNILGRSVALMIIVSIPLVIGGLALANIVIPFIFGNQYLPSIATFKILLVTLLIVFPSTLFGNALFAYDEQKYFVKSSAIAGIGNIFFNALLIPIWGIEGAAISTVVTQLLTNIFVWIKIRQTTGMTVWSHLKNYFKLLK